MNKQTTLKIAVALVAVMVAAHPLQAQFLKNIINGVKQTVSSRADDKAVQATNKAIDKGVSAGSAKNKGTQGTDAIDTSSVSRVLGAFAKAANDNPNDTSSADLVMKGLNNLVGGGGVSPSDSANAIKSFQSANGGSGVFVEYITTVRSAKTGDRKDTTRAYFNANGYARSEMSLPLPGTNHYKMVTLNHVRQPQYSVSLENDQRTYSLNVIDTSLLNLGSSAYQVVKAGNENVAGYACIHAKLTATAGRGTFQSSTSSDVWTSTEVPGYALIKNMMAAANQQPQMMAALNKAGCGGMIVKFSAQGKDYSTDMVLKEAKPGNFPASLFAIPAGYTRSDESTISRMMHSAR